MPNFPMSKRIVHAGNTMMAARILAMRPQPYQDGEGVNRVVETRGRKSGQMRRVPLAVCQYEGQRYLISPTRKRDWVHNLLASGECTLLSKTDQEQCHATLTLDDQAIKAVQSYMAHLPGWALQQFPFSASATAEEIRSKKEEFAVFQLA